MLKNIIAIIVSLSLGLASAFAAQPTSGTAKVVAVEANTVQVSIQGDFAAWMRKGAVLKVSTDGGQVIDPAARVTAAVDKTLTLTTKKPAGVKVGDTLSVQKGRSMTGC